jgi:MFS family permease
MVSIAMRQIILIGVICFGTIGMFNAMSSIGNAGKHSPTAQNLAITASSIAYILGFLIAGGTHNMLGPRPCVAFGGLTFFLYAGAMMLAKDDDHSPYPPIAGVLLGLGAGCIWVTQGAMMMCYPTENNKGKYIAVFWAIFNLGAVLGSILPLVMNNAPGMDKDDVTPSTYVVYMIIMGLATFLAFFLSRPSSIIRDNGEPIVVAKFAGIKAECMAILSVFCDWRMLLLIPAFFFSNFSYTYQFNDFNGVHFNIRTRCLNSILFWVAQILGALVIGYLLDRIPLRRPRRALLGLLFIACLFMATWIGALMMQLKHKWERKVAPNDSDLIDYQHGETYTGPLAIYAMFGFCDAAFAVYCYWLMGALSNKHDELSRYAGFFKSIQSLGSAVAAPLDLAQTPLQAYLITNWILCAFSIAAMFLVSRTVTDTTMEGEEDEEDEEEGYYEDTDSYYAASYNQDGEDGEHNDGHDHGRESEEHRHSDSRSRTIGGRDSSTLCATSERSKAILILKTDRVSSALPTTTHTCPRQQPSRASPSPSGGAVQYSQDRP